MSYSRSFTVAVTVTSNAGSGAFVFPNISGIKIMTIAIDAPSGATYDWVLKDSESYYMTGASAQSGDVTYRVELPISASGTITFSSATNGAYNVKIWAEYN